MRRLRNATYRPLARRFVASLVGCGCTSHLLCKNTQLFLANRCIAVSFSRLQVVVKKSVDVANDLRPGVVHMAHASLENEPVFEANLLTPRRDALHLFHPKRFVLGPNAQEQRRVIGSDMIDGADASQFLGSTFNWPLGEAVFSNMFLVVLPRGEQGHLKP